MTNKRPTSLKQILLGFVFLVPAQSCSASQVTKLCFKLVPKLGKFQKSLTWYWFEVMGDGRLRGHGGQMRHDTMW